MLAFLVRIEMKDAKDVLRKAVGRVTKDWVEAYSRLPDAEHMVKSLLIGVESGICERVGRRKPSYPIGVDSGAYIQGQQCAEKIPNAILRRACKF